jgi:TolB protein
MVGVSRTLIVLLCVPILSPTPATAAAAVGAFEASGDVGLVLHRGSTTFAGGTYVLKGSGENMWGAKDAFQFAWRKAAGDVSIAADVAFEGAGTDPHRKACLMIRQGLEEDAAYVDVAVHGEGLTSLQWRDAKGGRTHEVQANVKTPKRVRLEKHGKYAVMYLAAADGTDLTFSGAATRIEFAEPFYVGLAVCAHNKDVVESAVFSNVDVGERKAPEGRRGTLYSVLETQAIASTDRRVTLVTPARIEAPNWLKDGKTLIYNAGGKIYRVPADGGTPEAIDTGFANRCNNDHGVSPDGNTLVISDQSQLVEGKRPSLIYTLPIGGGGPKRITPKGPSYWHGWSPDGRTLAYCAERGGEFDVYTIAADGGGEERRLTTAKGLDDGPEYSPDGRYIYFNSDRTGTMQIWRMRAGDGAEQEQVTDDGYHNWFPHLSPDGKRMVFVSFEKDVVGHPADKDVTLRMIELEGKRVQVLGGFLGGQGTANVPCWSPDGKRIAFVTYQWVP